MVITETEIWRTIIANDEIYDNYKVSNLGRILSLNYNKTGKPKLLKPYKGSNGYRGIILWKDRKRKKFSIHRLVAETFIPNPNNLPQVNHKDENKENNFVGTPENNYKDGNLEWCTSEYNNNYGTRLEKTSKKVLQFTKSGEFIREYPSTMECERNGFSHSAVCQCCNGERKSHKGFIWKYKE